MASIDDRIRNIDNVICRHIASADFSSRGAVAQDILAHLRNFVEHIMLKFYANGRDIENTYPNICAAIDYVQTRGELRSLYRFHNYLQIVASHYTLDEENSERLMLKYYEYLLTIKGLLHEKFNLDVLSNLENFPLHVDETLQEYYEIIAEKVCRYDLQKAETGEKYYIQKIKPFFVNQEVYYEVTFTPANDYASKFNPVIAFTRIKITDYYAARFSLVPESIDLLGKTMPITIIVGWSVSIRDCEYKNFIGCVTGRRHQVPYPEQKEIGRFLTSTGLSLSDLLNFSDVAFQYIRKTCMQNARKDIVLLKKYL